MLIASLPTRVITGLLLGLCLYWPQRAQPGPVPPVIVLEVKGAIGPAVADYLVRGIDLAQVQDAPAVIIRMDTPGGLDSSMREIIRAILASSVPVATYVAPGGARAASAGTYILYASHAAAMAPGTNLGAATPVRVGGGLLPEKTPAKGAKQGQEAGGDTMEHKIVNDAAAYIRGLARMRGRNAQWAEQAVREAASLNAEEALKQGVIDLIADDLPGLLRALDGRSVSVQGKMRTLHTAGAGVRVLRPDWRSRLLAVITDPNVAYILMLLGIYGLFFEMANPGHVVPGVAGAIALLLALYAFQVLPVNYAGLALMGLGVAFMIAEVFVPSFGALGIGGIIAFVVGSLMLMDTDVEGYTLSVPMVVGFGLASAAFFMLVVTMVARLRRRPVVSGREEMLDSVGVVVDGREGRGRVWVHSELWEARSAQPLAQGQRVRIKSVDGLVLEVEPLNEES